MSIRPRLLATAIGFLSGISSSSTLPNYFVDGFTRINDSYVYTSPGTINNPGLPGSSLQTLSIPSGLSGLGQPSTFNAIASVTAGAAGGPLAGNVPFTFSTSQSEGRISTSGNVALFYYFLIDGPANVSVPVHMDYVYQTRVGSFYNGQTVFGAYESDATVAFTVASDSFSTPEIQGTIACPYNSGRCTNPDYQWGSSFGTLRTNTVYRVIIQSTGGAYSTITSGVGVNFAFSSAYLDPYFRIDSSFADAHLYAFSMSPGIVNAPLPAIPEPTSGLLLFVGTATILGRALLARNPRVKPPAEA